MAFNVNKLVLKDESKAVEPAPKPAPVPDPILTARFNKKPIPTPVKPIPKIVENESHVMVHKNSEPTVVVNGKAKKISKKSAFLLDMLTTDE